MSNSLTYMSGEPFRVPLFPLSINIRLIRRGKSAKKGESLITIYWRKLSYLSLEGCWRRYLSNKTFFLCIFNAMFSTSNQAQHLCARIRDWYNSGFPQESRFNFIFSLPTLTNALAYWNLIKCFIAAAPGWMLLLRNLLLGIQTFFCSHSTNIFMLKLVCC